MVYRDKLLSLASPLAVKQGLLAASASPLKLTLLLKYRAAIGESADPTTLQRRIGEEGMARKSLIALGASVLFAFPASAADYWGVKLANPATQFIFGYGSLINSVLPQFDRERPRTRDPSGYLGPIRPYSEPE
jgi:hypothetical protein